MEKLRVEDFMEKNTLKKIVMTAPSVARKKTPELVYRVSGGGGQRLFITVIKKNRRFLS